VIRSTRQPGLSLVGQLEDLAAWGNWRGRFQPGSPETGTFGLEGPPPDSPRGWRSRPTSNPSRSWRLNPGRFAGQARPRRLRRFLAVLVLAAALVPAGCAPDSPPAPLASEAQPGFELVARVVDGDTLALAGGERVRLLGVDAPELHAGRRGHHGPFPEPGAIEARAFLAALVEGRAVRLERRGRDLYGRTLAPGPGWPATATPGRSS
jgi:hypothetical protein